MKHYMYKMRAYFLVYIVLLLGQPYEAASAVFEQTDNDVLSKIGGGAWEDTPPATPQNSPESVSTPPKRFDSVITGASEGASEPTVHGSVSSVLLDLSPAIPKRLPSVWKASLRLTGGGARSLPRPRPMPERFSQEQHRMRMLARDVALDFAHMSGVAKAGLNTGAFVGLFTSMIHRESNYNARAVSPAGARGLGQLMPATARALGVCDVFSARENLEGAARYLTMMLDRFASPSLALAAYNAGPGAVEKYGGIPPYRETTQYVADIVHAVSLNTAVGQAEEVADNSETVVRQMSDVSITKTCL